MLVVICSILFVLFVDKLLAVLNNNAFEVPIYLLASKVVHWSILVLSNLHVLDTCRSTAAFQYECIEVE